MSHSISLGGSLPSGKIVEQWPFCSEAHERYRQAGRQTGRQADRQTGRVSAAIKGHCSNPTFCPPPLLLSTFVGFGAPLCPLTPCTAAVVCCKLLLRLPMMKVDPRRRRRLPLAGTMGGHFAFVIRVDFSDPDNRTLCNVVVTRRHSNGWLRMDLAFFKVASASSPSLFLIKGDLYEKW